jgi:hypothetical protein
MASYGTGPDPYANVPPGGGGGNAQQLVQGPAIGVLVVGIINALYGAYQIFNGLMFNPQEALRAASAQNPHMSKEEANMVTQIMSLGGPMAIVFGLVTLAVAALIIFGAIKMKNLESMTLAKVGSIVAMIPCLSPCCIAGLPIGIWALMVLNKPEVKAGFRS